MLDLNYLWDFLGITTAKMESSEERFKVGLQSKCSKGDFWRGILALLGLVLCIPSTIFYIRGDKRSVTSFIELLLLSVGAFLLAFSILSTILSCIRMGQNRRKLENLIVDETRHDDVLQWIHLHHRMHNGKSFKTTVFLYWKYSIFLSQNCLISHE